jgi:FkbM family methyltransferase
VSTFVYDIGLHDGGDTYQYLKEGSRVVAIDANPTMCTAAKARFADYISTGQLKVLNCGVGDQKGEFTFWVCDDVPEWSSFHERIASRNGAKHHSLTVECVPIGDVIKEHGTADYMKIDIEGNDRVCIAGLSSATAPPYISIEMDHFRGNEDLRRLAELGYQDFKVICQNNSWHQVTKHNMWLYQRGPTDLMVGYLRRLRALFFKRLAGRRQGESGPWGEKTSGAWHSMADALTIWSMLSELDKRLNTSGIGWWFDVHARRRA